MNRYLFYKINLKKLIKNRESKILILAGGQGDKKVLMDLGFKNVTISNLDSRMDENEYKMILGVYQKKTHEMLAQIIALETRVLGLNNVVEQLSTKVTDQENLLIQLKSKNKQPKNITVDSEGF